MKFKISVFAVATPSSDNKKSVLNLELPIQKENRQSQRLQLVQYLPNRERTGSVLALQGRNRFSP